jgi:FKBP-type peptidyl-prolyl cis-trans isomerase 2
MLTEYTTAPAEPLMENVSARISPDHLADIEFRLQYNSAEAGHTDRYVGRSVNFWRDLLPEPVYDALMGARAGESFELEFNPGDLLPPFDSRKSQVLHRRQFDAARIHNRRFEPRYGRFYPKGLLKEVAGVYPQNREPFRCIAIDGSHLGVDFNHPLARLPLRLTARVLNVRPKMVERGGTSIDWIETVTDGPGMQSRLNGRATDFISDDALARADESSDLLFYREPRFVNHIDDQAAELIRTLYGKLVPSGAHVLDLMSSWVSHLPTDLETASVTGLGLNRSELAANERLTDFLVHDLNEHPQLPLAGSRYDAVLCTVSVEYLTDPLAVFADVARVLKPGGVFVVTFSNRWFPPKAIRLWQEIHDFERMGLVLDYFLDSGRYRDLETLSVRGYPRPIYDKYYPELQLSDPVLAVWGRCG